MSDSEKKFALQQKSKGGLMRLWKAFCYSCAGFRAAFLHEHACRQEIFIFIPLAIFAFVMPIDFFSKILLVLPMPVILGFEMLNSAVEAIVDDISLDYRELAKRAKDLGSAAVFCAMVFGVLLWIAVIGQNILDGKFDAWFAAVRNFFAS